MASPTVQDVIRTAFPRFDRDRSCSISDLRVLERLRVCRTAEGGGYVEACPAGHHQRFVYLSCYNRNCATCRHLNATHFLERQVARALDVAHQHIVMTVPHQLNEFWLSDYRSIATVLFDAASATMKAAAATRLGTTTGFIMALHTWSQRLELHPHMHIVTTWGGLEENGTWREPALVRNRAPAMPNGAKLKRPKLKRPKYIYKFVDLSHDFRRRFLDLLKRRVRSGDVPLPRDWNGGRFQGVLTKLYKTNWRVHLEPRYENPIAVMKYLVAYVRGGPIGNSRIVKYENERVTFEARTRNSKHEDEGRPQRYETLHDVEFIRRLTMHFPPKGFVTFRGYGLYANAAKTKKRADARVVLYQPPEETPVPKTAQQIADDKGFAEQQTCPVCARQLQRVKEFTGLLNLNFRRSDLPRITGPPLRLAA